jgi:hypothetical protein
MDAPLEERCRVCGGRSLFVFGRALLGREVNYFDCPTCGYVQTESPTWLEEAYSSAINDVDTGILLRNRINVGRVIMALAAFGRLRGRVVDHAGGYGILVRLLRDAGVDAWWRDKYCDNLLARGFEHDGAPCEMLTAFELFEHLVDPVADLRAMLGEAPVVVLSTDLVPGPATSLPDWWYLGTEHGQHIGFFRPATLRWMAAELGCHHASDGRAVHVFSRRPIPATWQPLLRLSGLWPLVARRLQSRTSTDFVALRRRRTGTP